MIRASIFLSSFADIFRRVTHCADNVECHAENVYPEVIAMTADAGAVPQALRTRAAF
jgi:hypothetical protein